MRITGELLRKGSELRKKKTTPEAYIDLLQDPCFFPIKS